MLGLGLSIPEVAVGHGSGVDPATTAWANAVVGAGGAVSATQKGRVDTLIRAGKAHGWFATLDRFWIHGGESDAKQATIDIVNLGTLTIHGSLTLAAGGYTGDASTGYADTNFNPSTAGGNFAQNSALLATYIRNSRTTQQNWAALGNFITNDTRLMVLQAGGPGGFLYSVNEAAAAFDATQTQAQGSWSITRTASNLQSAYKNSSSSAFTTTSNASTALNNGNIFLFAFNNGGSPSAFSGDQHLASVIGGALTGAQAAQLQTDLNAYATAWGLNVY